MPTKPSRTLTTLLFPAEPRQFTGQRLANIVLRTAHLVGIAGIGGGFLHNLAEPLWLPFWYLTLASGIGLALLYIAASAVWLVQLRGIAILLKIALIGVAIHWPQLRAEFFVAVIVISGLIAHAPGRIRGWRPWG